MTAVPTIHTFAAGEVATAANINLFGTAINFLLAPPILEIRQTVAQSVANGSAPATPITYTTEDADSSGMHSTSVNTSRATAVYPGWYSFSGNVGFVASASGSRGGAGAVNGTTIQSSFNWLPANGSGLTSTPFKTKLVFLNVADYFEWFCAQTSGGALNTSVGNTEQSGMTGRWESN